jgi:hypothetical protein
MLRPIYAKREIKAKVEYHIGLAQQLFDFTLKYAKRELDKSGAKIKKFATQRRYDDQRS